LYGVAALLIVGSVVKDQFEEREAELHPHEFTVNSPSGRVYVVPAEYDWEAISAAQEYEKAHPIGAAAQEPSSKVRELTDEQLMAIAKGEYMARSGGSLASVTAAPGVSSGGDIFAQPSKTKAPVQHPIRVPVARYDHPRILASIAKSGGIAAMWCALVYAAMWAAFRGARWVALGFMDGKVAKPSD